MRYLFPEPPSGERIMLNPLIRSGIRWPTSAAHAHPSQK